jgi:hypothetical protein
MLNHIWMGSEWPHINQGSVFHSLMARVIRSCLRSLHYIFRYMIEWYPANRIWHVLYMLTSCSVLLLLYAYIYHNCFPIIACPMIICYLWMCAVYILDDHKTIINNIRNIYVSYNNIHRRNLYLFKKYFAICLVWCELTEGTVLKIRWGPTNKRLFLF